MVGQQFVSFNYILDKVRRETDSSNISIPDMKEDLWDVVGILGISGALEDKHLKDVPIDNFRAALPIDFYTLQPSKMAVRESSTRIPFRHLGDMFYLDQESYAGKPLNVSLIAGTSYFHDPADPTKTGTIYAEYVPGDKISEHYTYRLSRDYIFVGKKETELDIAYVAFPIDQYGAPMIADDPKYIRAVVTYLIERIDYRKWRKGQITDKLYEDSKQNYYFAAAAAQTHAALPSDAKMENLLNRAKLLLKGSHHFGTGYRDLGNP